MSALQSLTEAAIQPLVRPVYEFDVFRDSDLLDNPHRRMSELLHDAPRVFWTNKTGGHWVITRYEDAHRILQDPHTFSSSHLTPERKAAMMRSMPANAPRIPSMTPIFMDPPEHTRYRAILQKVFSPKSALKLKGEMEALAHELVAAIKPLGACDFIATVAEQFPVRLFLKMMGLPLARLAEFRALVREVHAPRGPNPLETGLRLRKVADAMMGDILARRDEPRDDLISQLWSASVDDQPMTLELIEDYAVLLFMAGLDTVVNAIGFGMHHLARDPQLQAHLRLHPEVIPAASEELLRRYTVVIPIRRVTRDVVFEGCHLKEGEMVFVCLPSADVDEQEFSDPEDCNLARENKRHMAFGHGVHRCLGSHIARLELQALYEVVLEQLPPFRLDPEKPARFEAGNMLTVPSLCLRWD